MIVDVEDTIVAVASPPGGARRGIIRISGNQTLKCLKQAFKFEATFKTEYLRQRCSLDCELRLNEQGGSLPGKLLVWPDCRSYTRQPTAEFHTLGSPPLLQLATAAICRTGARLAEPGEFTLRAFLSGRIDLTQAEAVLAVIDSKNQSQLDSALRQLCGGLTGPFTEIRAALVTVLAELEAGLDFVEEDIEFISQADLEASLTSARNQLAAINQQIQRRNLNREALIIAIAGPPNAGKSSLFNALLGDERAIVTDTEGTTRDFVSATLHWDQLNLNLIDTAGIVERLFSPHTAAERHIDSQAQFQTRTVLDQADIVLLCLDLNNFRPRFSSMVEALNRRDPESVIAVLTKTDLEPGKASGAIAELTGLRADIGRPGPVIATSSHDLSGLEQLRQVIVANSRQCQQNGGSFVAATATRAATSLESAEDSLVSALQAAREGLGLEIVASEIRQSLDELGSVVGTVYTDEILDQIFGRFCIGK